MTDEQMDARLRAAGEQWRAGNTAVAHVDTSDVVDARVDIAAAVARARRWQLLASAAVGRRSSRRRRDVPAARREGTPAPSGDTAALQGHVWLVDRHAGRTRARRSTSTATATSSRTTRAAWSGRSRSRRSTATVTGARVVRYKSCTDQYAAGLLQTAALSVLTGDVDLHGSPRTSSRSPAPSTTSSLHAAAGRDAGADARLPDADRAHGGELTDAIKRLGSLGRRCRGSELRLDQGKVSGRWAVAVRRARHRLGRARDDPGSTSCRRSCATAPPRAVLTGQVHATVSRRAGSTSPRGARNSSPLAAGEQTGHDPA